MNLTDHILSAKHKIKDIAIHAMDYNIDELKNLELSADIHTNYDGTLEVCNAFSVEILLDDEDQLPYTLANKLKLELENTNVAIDFQIMEPDPYDDFDWETSICEINQHKTYEYSKVISSEDTKGYCDTGQHLGSIRITADTVSFSELETLARIPKFAIMYNELASQLGLQPLLVPSEDAKITISDLKTTYDALVKDRKSGEVSKLYKSKNKKDKSYLEELSTHMLVSNKELTVCTQVTGINLATNTPNLDTEFHTQLPLPTSYLDLDLDNHASNRVEKFEDTIRRKGNRWEIGGGYYRTTSETPSQQLNAASFLMQYFPTFRENDDELDINLDVLYSFTKITKTLEVGSYYRIETDKGILLTAIRDFRSDLTMNELLKAVEILKGDK